MLTTKGLEALRAFVETGSVTQASVRLNRTQPQVGRLLSNLEEEVGFALFQRTKKRLSLTPDGWSFYRQVERHLASQESLQKLAGRLKARQNNHVRVLTAPHLSNAIVNDALAIMAERSARFSASIDSRVRLDIETWVGQENFDLGVTVLPLENPLLEVEPFISVEVVAAMSADHPFASKPVITVDDLSGESLIALHPRSLIRQSLSLVTESLQPQPNIRFETTNGILACQLAARGLGIAISDPFIATSSEVPLVLRPFQPAITLDYGFIFPAWQERSGAVNELANLIKEHAEKRISAIRDQQRYA
ncbi:LysR family transcriptional regulator [Pseudomonas wayambapalatensis]|nr:LysR family transcriptional regulator [Pseudomonas wayambapalatensis]